MGGEILAGVVLQYIVQLLPLVQRLFQNPGVPPSAADWDELQKLAGQTAQWHILAAAARAGLPLDDPRVKALLEMARPVFLPPPPPPA